MQKTEILCLYNSRRTADTARYLCHGKAWGIRVKDGHSLPPGLKPDILRGNFLRGTGYTAQPPSVSTHIKPFHYIHFRAKNQHFFRVNVIFTFCSYYFCFDPSPNCPFCAVSHTEQTDIPPDSPAHAEQSDHEAREKDGKQHGQKRRPKRIARFADPDRAEIHACDVDHGIG